ncbi:HTH-type transcriptional regulator BetI [Clostridium tepidiprofundi DSM 19306]|uniref:HTH-type transcriptional regulator BetI n=1 Tax=Clostridium tepidiprofundi DSM 19306 TaxID=1121338 RepID=A0A151B261_9CLOT|nr:TetR/AcrR family transcriptional regulator [Clostridium tepidiprofundi]KYH33988.1 HTH-type transcriptional regulator BetI [Clostridium tepidiprofundi DSM 19306]
MDKKLMQKRRIMGYFIEATNKIIEEEGIDAVTIRKVADMAGYNSATLYNYFKNLNHLIFFASMKYLKDYALDLYDYTKDSKNSLENYVNIWKCFSYHSYLKPEIYNLIFFGEFTSSAVNDSIKEYYSIFPEELGKESKQYLPMLLEDNIYLRDYQVLKICAKEGFFKEEDLTEINEMNILIYQGMLCRMLNKNKAYTVEDAVERTLKYVNRTLSAYRIDI